jgi:uncharacterized coiled-coil DUF342 family protein
MTTENQGVMSRWMHESTAALEQLRRERDHHERALEAAMESIRVHTQSIDAIERDIAVIEKAIAGTEDRKQPEPATTEAQAAAEEFEVSLPTKVHASMVPPRPPPLRPVPLPRASGQR